MELKHIIQMLLSFESYSEKHDSTIYELLQRAIDNKPTEFAKTVFNTIKNDEKSFCFTKLDVEENAEFFFALNFFANEIYTEIPTFEEFIETHYNIDNKYASDTDIIHKLFNHMNNSGMAIKSGDIVEMTDETHKELKQLILDELVYYTDEGEYAGIVCFPTMFAESETRAMCMLDLHHVDHNDEDVEFEIDIPGEQYLSEYPSCKEIRVKDGVEFAFYPKSDQTKYTPLVIDCKNKRVYFSLQGDIKMLLDPNTYSGWKAGYEQDKAAMAAELEAEMQKED